MALRSTLLLLAIFGIAITGAQTIPGAALTGEDVKPVQTQLPTVGQSQQGSDFTFTGPNQVFGATDQQGSLHAGVQDRKPVLEANPAFLNGGGGRKMLQGTALSLAGDGTQVGNDQVGTQGAAFGQGGGGLKNPHIQPHGYEGDVSLLGQGVNDVHADVNPDGVIAGQSHGPVTTVGRKLQ